ncbi:MAG: carboxylating nicotinate-nucleotide diphosphorylase [Desulfurivibrionaceae bacterium]
MDILDLKRRLENFLIEDIGNGDITSEAIFSRDQQASAQFVARESFIAAGLESIMVQLFLLCNQDMEGRGVKDGTRVEPGDVIFTVQGPVIDLLRAERVGLNLAQRLSGIATHTNSFVRRVEDLPVKIVDTRKTTPGLRGLEKYAVRVGGGGNHRFNLTDGILIKDNHITACGSISRAVQLLREKAPHTFKVEVEAESLDQVSECLEAGVDIIMLDNMDIPNMEKAVELTAGKALLEASGGVTLDNVRAIAETGVDLISVGGLTHSAPNCDISMRITSSLV